MKDKYENEKVDIEIPKQKYVLSGSDKCHRCGGELGRELYLSNPPQRKCLNCDNFCVQY